MNIAKIIGVPADKLLRFQYSFAQISVKLARIIVVVVWKGTSPPAQTQAGLGASV